MMMSDFQDMHKRAQLAEADAMRAQAALEEAVSRPTPERLRAWADALPANIVVNMGVGCAVFADDALRHVARVLEASEDSR